MKGVNGVLRVEREFRKREFLKKVVESVGDEVYNCICSAKERLA